MDLEPLGSFEWDPLLYGTAFDVDVDVDVYEYDARLESITDMGCNQLMFL